MVSHPEIDRCAGAPAALRGHCVLRWGQDVPSFPHAPFLTAAFFLRFAPDRFLLTKPSTSYAIELPASLRSDGVRDHPGMPFGFPSEQAFSFTGIPRSHRLTVFVTGEGLLA